MRRRLLPLLSLLALGTPAPALGARAQFSAAHVTGDGWSATGVEVTVSVDPRHRPALQLQAKSARLPAGLGSATRVRLHCPHLLTPAGRWRCRGATLQGHFPTLGEQQLTVDFDYQPRNSELTLEVSGLQVAGGAAGVKTHARGVAWETQATLSTASLPALQALTQPWAAWPEGTWEGEVSARMEAAGNGSHTHHLALPFTLHKLDFARPDGLTATAALAGEGRVQWQSGTAAAAPHLAPHLAPQLAPRLALDFAARSGQVYLDPVFLDAGKFPFALQATGQLEAAPDGWKLTGTQGGFTQPGILTANATGTVDFGAGALLRDVAVTLQVHDTTQAWPLYAGPFLASTDFKDLTAQGGLGGRIVVHDGNPTQVDLALQELTFSDPAGTLELRSIQGALHWSAEGHAEPIDPTRLAFAGGRFYGLPFGAAEWRLQTHGRDARLLQPFTLPVLDGGLQVNTFRVRHAGEPDMWLRLDAAVLPIDMAALSRAFGWPEFGGKLAGRIPKAALDDGVLTLGGNLEADVFGGRVTLQNLRLQDALGRFPQFQADVALQELDLALLTGTFEFGFISGRLSGTVQQLQLFDWRPVAFDARLATPQSYRGDRRITPRAVQNLSSLGGGSGVTSALSGGFLRFFKDFEYRQLGIACRLEQDVCRMGGVAPAPGGYYLIEGAGFPRINLIGSQGRVAWSKLLRQLERLGQGASLEVE